MATVVVRSANKRWFADNAEAAGQRGGEVAEHVGVQVGRDQRVE